MKPLALLQLMFLLQCNLQLFTMTRAAFSFTTTILTHSTNGNCFGDDLSGACETFFPTFCLRGPRGTRSTSITDCPLGRVNGLSPSESSGSRVINSNAAWPGSFQLFFQALDDDGSISNPDHLEDIFFNVNLEANLSFLDIYIGSRLTITLTFQIDCRTNYYGGDCLVFCMAQDTDQAGHYTCDQGDGSRICLNNYYGSECRTFCQPFSDETNGFYTCDADDGSRICLPDYYGADCRTFCQPFSDETNGFYTCDADDGSRMCLPDYYRSDCRTFCQASNDGINGFYTCTNDGSRTCREGFTDPQTFCTENIDDCVGNLCENGATCVDLVSGYVCDCPAGYTGEFCTVDINECLEPAAICPENSTCEEDSLNSFHCRCNPGFEGEDCTEIQPCAAVPCANGGTCVSEGPFSYECLCPAGFNGSSCEIDDDECRAVQCENGRTCISNEPLSFECVCADGYAGLACEDDIDECLLQETCPTDLLCVNEEPGFVCQTLPGGAGSNQALSRANIIIIGSVVSGIVALILLVCIVVIILFLARRKMKVYRTERSESHVYHSPPSRLDSVKNVSLSPVNGKTQENIDFNPLYGKSSPLRAATGSPVLHTFENSLYGVDPSNQNGNAVIYDQIGTKVPVSDSHDGIELCDNSAYGSLTSPHNIEAISNPMYGGKAAAPQLDSATYSVPRTVGLAEVDGYTILRAEGGNGPVSYSVPVPNPSQTSPEASSALHGKEVASNPMYGGFAAAAPQPPDSATYSVPRPVNGLTEVDGYTVLKPARSTVPSYSDVPAPSTSRAQYETVELSSKDRVPNKHTDSPFPLPQETSFGPGNSSELSYAVPANVRSASMEASRYSKLTHAPEPAAKPVRQAKLPDSGYTGLETQS